MSNKQSLHRQLDDARQELAILTSHRAALEDSLRLGDGEGEAELLSRLQECQQEIVQLNTYIQTLKTRLLADTPAGCALTLLGANTLILDTETTGLHPSSEVIEISLIDCEGNVLLDTLVKPLGSIPSAATAVHNITEEMCASAPSWTEVHERYAAIVEGRHVLIFNAPFDLRLIDQTYAQHQISPEARPAFYHHCMMKLYSDHINEPGRYGKAKWQSLAKAVDHCQIEWKGDAHRALADCFATLDVLKWLAAQEVSPCR